MYLNIFYKNISCYIYFITTAHILTLYSFQAKLPITPFYYIVSYMVFLCKCILFKHSLFAPSLTDLRFCANPHCS